jgi:hypothetical protein
MDNVPRCQHVKTNGVQCGSPALRRRRRCFFHERIRRERAKIAADGSAERGFDLPLLEDANSVQVALMKVIQMLGSGRMDHKTAGLILYALQTASVNLRNAQFEAEDATHVVIDRNDVHRTSIGGPQWFEEDFEEEADEEESADGDEIKDKDDSGDQLVAADAGGKVQPEQKPEAQPEVKHVTVEEARMRVRGVVRNWLLSAEGQKALGKPG